MANTVTITVELPVDELRAVQSHIERHYWDLLDSVKGDAVLSAHQRFRAACRDTPIPRPIQVGDRVERVGTFGTVQAVVGERAWVWWDSMPLGHSVWRLADLTRIEDDQ